MQIDVPGIDLYEYRAEDYDLTTALFKKVQQNPDTNSDIILGKIFDL